MSGAPDWHRNLHAEVEAQVSEAIHQCGRLPVLDRTVRRVLELTDDEESQTSDLVAVLEADPALAANILRYANSAFVGRPIAAKTIRQAVMMVGRRATRQLCLESVTFRFFESAPGNGRASLGQLHIHAVTVASVAASAAQMAGIPKDLPHLAGLLHDCGKLVMPLAFGREAMDELAATYHSGVQRSEAEWERFGIDHAYAGAMFAEDSGLDDLLAAAIAWHHGGRRGCVTPSPEIACVQLANIVVAMLSGAVPDQTLLEASLKRLGLGAEALDQLAESATSITSPSVPAGLGERVAELERVASIDELTGIANRRHWMASVRCAVRSGEAGSLLLCDVDHFKQINDTHGHPTGDLVLMEVARILTHHGLAGRIGGDEFALWIKAGDDESCAAEKIVAEVTAAFEDGNGLKVGVSIGVAPDVKDVAAAIELADRALYAAKAGGRRRASRTETLPAAAPY